MTHKPLASISLDLDNKWSYLKTHGDEEWEAMPSYFHYVVPRFLSFLKDRNTKITVFVVGQDAVLDKNREALAAIAEDGHEIGNHSFNHEPWLHLYTPSELNQEFEKSENAIRDVTGKQTIGFRGPGFSLSDEVLRTLVRRGYEYDCSTFPTYLGPVARAYYFLKSSLTSEEKEDRKVLFGSFKDGLQSNKPFRWNAGNSQLLEIPVTTMPILKLPIHGSYIMYLATYSVVLAKAYFWSALQFCRMTGVEPWFLLHSLDFMGEEDDEDMSFFPGMNQPAVKKIELLGSCFKMLEKHFELVTMQEHANSLKAMPMKSKGIDTAPQGATELAKSSAS